MLCLVKILKHQSYEVWKQLQNNKELQKKLPGPSFEDSSTSTPDLTIVFANL